MLNGRAFMTARGATGAALQLVARRISPQRITGTAQASGE